MNYFTKTKYHEFEIKHKFAERMHDRAARNKVRSMLERLDYCIDLSEEVWWSNLDDDENRQVEFDIEVHATDWELLRIKVDLQLTFDSVKKSQWK